MSAHGFDKSSKWLLQRHGRSILYLGGARNVRQCRSLQAELVQPRRLPDGLLEVVFQGRRDADYFLVEVATYPERRLADQVLDGLLLAYAQLRVLPEMLTLVLHPKGRVRIGGRRDLQSRLGWSQLQYRWRTVELWTLPAEELLAAGDIGLIPWVPLTRFEGPPRALLEQCRERIEQDAASDEKANLLAVTQVLTRLRFSDLSLLTVLGGSQVMIESPLIKELVAEARQEAHQEARQEDILAVLQARFGELPAELARRVRAVRSRRTLDALVRHAARCPDLDVFRKRLPS
jgi:predicted transposase YdaD